MAEELRGLIFWTLHLYDGNRISVEHYYANGKADFRIESLAGRCDTIVVQGQKAQFPTFIVDVPLGASPTVFLRNRINTRTNEKKRMFCCGYIDKGTKSLFGVPLSGCSEPLFWREPVRVISS